ncbi:MAG TPA: hypothetical protein VJ645_05200, partial [Gaiellaceae bacterium]|nr:hypothetical protein [Gaiellaceae bacterium]
GNVSLYNETDGRAIPPTPVVGCIGLVPDVRYVPQGWCEGDVIVAASAEGLKAEAALVRFVARATPLLSLAHDVGDGGTEAALAEAALWSGIGAEVDVSEDARVLLACPPERVGRLGAEFEQIGVAGGTTLLGRSLDELQAAWEANR